MKRKKEEPEHKIVGDCPICDRPMYENVFIDDHHLIPKSKNGRYGDKITIHRICHDKIHSVWTETELANFFYTVGRIRAHDDMKTFVKWLSKKEPDFYVKTKRSTRRKKRR